MVCLDHTWIWCHIRRHIGSRSREVGGRGTEGGRGRPRRRYVAAAALGTMAGILTGCRYRSAAGGLASSSGLVSVVGVLPLMANFLLFREPLPGIFNFFGLLSPLLADEFRDLWICESRMPSGDLALVVLPIKDECC